MVLPLEIPEEYQHPEWTGDPIEVIEDTGITYDAAMIDNWAVKLTFNTNTSGSGFFTHIPGAKHDVILTAAHNLIAGGNKTTNMRVHIGPTDLLPIDQGGLGLGGNGGGGAGATGSGTSSTGNSGSNVKAIVISVPNSDYRISQAYEADESKKEADFGAILLPLGTFTKLQLGYGFGYSLRLAEEEYLKGRMCVTGYGDPTRPGAPKQAPGRFINCKKKQLEYNAITEPGISGSVVWMEYDGGPVAVGIHNHGGDEKKPTGNSNRKNKGSRITLDLMLEVLAWPGIEVGRLNHQLTATGNQRTADRSALNPLPSNGLFLFFDEGWDFAQVRRGSGSRFDVYPVQTNSCLASKDIKVWIGMILKDPWAIQGKPKWVYFRHGANREVRWTESFRNDCLLEELPISGGKTSASKQLVRRIPDPGKPNKPPTGFQLALRGNNIDPSDIDGVSSEAEVIAYPSGPKSQASAVRSLANV